MKHMPTILWEIHYHYDGKWKISEFGCDAAGASEWFEMLRREGNRAEFVQVTTHRKVIDVIHATNSCGFKRKERQP